MAYGTVNADVIGTSVAGSNLGAGDASLMKNRIINGAMVIDQRNAGASVTPTNGQYTLDRWESVLTQASKYTVQQNAGSVTPPAGFTNYLGITSSSAYSIASGDLFGLRQAIEGFNVADLGWGTANAKTVTISAWVRSSLTGTFGGSILNSAQNRSYPFSYTISSANTWTQISVTIAGDTSGTWLTTNGVGMYVFFGLGAGATYSGTAGAWSGSTFYSATGATSVVGTSGATFYITGVQLEVGSSATGYEYRQYGTELALCQRYYYRTEKNGNYSTPTGYAISTTQAYLPVNFPVTMRTRPTALEQSGTASDYQLIRFGNGAGVNCSSVPVFNYATPDIGTITLTVSSGLVNSGAGSVYFNNSNAYFGWSAEL
jgi:hypothetical protein